VTNPNLFPGTANAEPDPGSNLDPESIKAIKGGRLIKFAPAAFVDEGRHKDAGEYHAALLCAGRGDTLTFSITSADAARQAGQDAGWMDLGTGGAGAVYVRTETNRYVISNGYIYNHNLGGAFAIDPNASQMQLRIGRGAILPGAGNTSPIKSILLTDEVKYGDVTYSWTGHNVSEAPIVKNYDPFINARAIGEAVSKGADPREAVGTLRDDILRLQGRTSFL